MTKREIALNIIFSALETVEKFDEKRYMMYEKVYKLDKNKQLYVDIEIKKIVNQMKKRYNYSDDVKKKWLESSGEYTKFLVSTINYFNNLMDTIDELGYAKLNGKLISAAELEYWIDKMTGLLDYGFEENPYRYMAESVLYENSDVVNYLIRNNENLKEMVIKVNEERMSEFLWV